jgi:molybdenum cofactor synthesis domain-containing protein
MNSTNHQITLSILIISDRAYQKIRDDQTGPLLQKYALENKWIVLNQMVVPDEVIKISDILQKWCDENNHPDIIFTSGGTGLASRDVTPEATLKIIEKEVPGISEYLRMKSTLDHTHAILSRGVSGIRNKTLIINLPGNPAASIENIRILQPILPHAINVLRDDPEVEKNHLKLL